MKKFILPTLLAATAFTLAPTPSADAHCQVPCGIYDDANVLAEMKTDIATIKKAMGQITELAGDSKNANQVTRWVNNKEQHAQNIQDTVAKYFLAQRIKLDESNSEEYIKKLTLLHQITVYAMKCKQTTDVENVTKLDAAYQAFVKAYHAH
ncbi:superoxide dismutase [Ni] [Persicirhabdus sediminis]|uniref:Nickel superoxide dismutase n=1 Tax=Persicirhabdus sediminis TaxID=454144 RepID=A0A8J7MEZ0_9BACT|nr:superoxide dismutase [Ni] [Persicirhabdus sediminis]MBK1792729.1 hypothetical protein [Persicirhabdus sediminis]